MRFVKTKVSKGRILFTLGLAVFLCFLVGIGWVAKGGIFEKIKSLGLNRADWVEPVAKETTGNQIGRQLKELGLKEGRPLIGEPKVKDSNLMATFSGQLTVFLNLKKDITPQLASLQFILWRSKIEGNKPKRVDLRFEKPVVEY